jgi:enoyl-CoA hydratase/carnithine racemase
MTEHFLVERDGPTALLTFNRPDARNSMTFEMYEALHDACAALDADPSVRALVIKGAGDRAFASGTDIRQFLDFATREDALDYEARLTRVLTRLAGMSKPTIAMLQGDAIGGGLFIALACDLRLAAPHARFGIPVARTLGNFLAPVSLTLLVSVLGPNRAREIVLTARLLDAEEARTIGLVDRVHPALELESRAREMAASFAELAPLTLAATKEATRRMLAALAPRDLDDLIVSCYLSRDFHEGVRAFLEKRSLTGGGADSLRGSSFRRDGLSGVFEQSQSNSLLVGGRMTPPGAPSQHLVVARHIEDAALELMQERDVLVAAAGRAGRVAQLEALFASHADGEAAERDRNP